jgi:hypothetical protein
MAVVGTPLLLLLLLTPTSTLECKCWPSGPAEATPLASAAEEEMSAPVAVVPGDVTAAVLTLL